MSIRQAILADLSTVKHIAETTISEIYPHYYPEGAVDFFLEHHSEEKFYRTLRGTVSSFPWTARRMSPVQ